jgi:hypothetical protein
MTLKKFQTDLLFGVVSGFNNKHFLLADIDGGDREELMKRVGIVCIERHQMGDCYVVRTGKGWHVTNFTDELTLKEYIQILKELQCDPKYIWWVKKVRYGVLRVSRRSSHWNVPYLDAVFISPFKKKEHEVKKSTYFGLLEMEQNFKNVQRVSVLYDKKDYIGKLSNRDLSAMRKDIRRVQCSEPDKKGKVKGSKGMGKDVLPLHNRNRKGVA